MPLDLSYQIVLIAVAAMAAQWISWKLRTPAIVFLLLFGFLLGPVMGWLQPQSLMGPLLRPAISAAVAIILFEGSLHLRVKDLREGVRPVRHVILLGVPIGWALISMAAHFIAAMDWPVAITFGGVLIVTGPTVIMPMLRHARLNAKIGAVLKWEGIVNDPLGVLLAVLAYEYFSSDAAGPLDIHFFLSKGAILVAVVSLSFALSHLIMHLFERGAVPEYLKAPFLLCTVLSIFFASNAVLQESGLIAVTVLGMTLANIRPVSLEEIHKFKETITLLLVSGVFLLLTADQKLDVLTGISWQGMAFVVILLFVIRPLTIAIASIGSTLTWREIALIGWIAPRGVVCAAMAGVIGPLLVAAGFPGGDRILPISFFLVVVSVLLQGLTVKPLARFLKLTSDETNGIIIVGSHPWTIQLAEILKARNTPVMIVDTDYQEISKARLASIPVYYGEILSEETELNLEFHRYDTVLAATANAAYNAFICDKFGYSFGRDRMFHISLGDSAASERRKISSALQGRIWVDDKLTLDRLDTLFADGWRFKLTRVGKSEDGALILPEESDARLIAGFIQKNGVINFYHPDHAHRGAPKEDDFILLFENPAP